MNKDKDEIINELLKIKIDTVKGYIDVIDVIDKIKKRLCYINNNHYENMDFFYRGDKSTAKLCPKIFLNQNCLDFEARTFKERFACREDKTENELHYLCNSQHQGRCTRLLDFSKDPLVALRFACGRDEKCNKRITIFYTNSIKRDEKDFEDEDIKALMKLVMSEDLEDFTDDEKRRVSKDYFIDFPGLLYDVERYNRQGGAFLFPGNLEQVDRDYHGNKKVIHKLSEKTGRGQSYPGYIVNIPIKKEYVKNIRDELEKTEKYNMDYLLCKK